ncbi:hypothetical protein HU200_065135 [Digitaria exilis]|uniref:non-specific serine/threonine protein kinase n=1 Tax=Digitaria exilis TaxID=1010633 RepID=A0A835DXT9_9POAL|nr:hypothetical protein HU200_065135 [Digitaria exilis]
MALLVFLLLFATSSVHVAGQTGFLNIDCGMDDMQSGYKDRDTGLFYVGDGTYTDGGENLRASSEYEGIYQRPFLTVRSFPSGERNCYALPTEAGARYLVRFRIYYGNHDGKNNSRLTRFDLHIGANYWDTADASSYTPWYEAVFMAWASWAPVCLVNTGSGVPFVSTLELRLLGDTLYPSVTASEWMAMYYRANMGSNIDFTRFPSDGYDRFWWQTNFPEWARKSTTETIKEDPNFAEPLVVLQTPDGRYNITLAATAASMLPPMLNAVEVYTLIALDSPTTYPTDFLKHITDPTACRILVDVIMAIKIEYGVKKNWMGDPCFPVKYAWDGIKCSNTSDNTMRITSMDLSYNNITGSIPDSLPSLPSLRVLNLSGNHLTGDSLSLLDPARESKLQNALGSGKGHGDYLKSEYRLFTYKELKKLTNNFKQVIGKGGKNGVAEALNWETRLRIVLEAAQGLDYLHKGCSMPIVHRDLKTSNILLGNNLQAKIADFGLSKTYLSDTQTHISTTNLAGTAEVVTGQAPTRMGYGHIVQRVKKQIATGNINSVADARLAGAYDINSMWNVVETAIMCTQDSAAQRPTMSTVVVLLKESLALEEAREKGSSVRASPTTDTAALVSRVGSLAR